MKIIIVIPAFKVSNSIIEVVENAVPRSDTVIVVDDKCPECSGKKVEQAFKGEDKVIVLYNKENLGVGGATITGYLKALEFGSSIILKIDGDGQMDPKYVNRITSPIKKGLADFAKANRFFDREALSSMPPIRRIGNIALSAICKVVTGFWHISDPTNGYTAINSKALTQVNLNKVYRDYFFEISMLIRLNTIRATAMDVPVPAKYGDETSSLRVTRILRSFPFHLIRGLGARIFWRYLIYDINAVTILLTSGGLFFGFGFLWGAAHWMESILSGVAQTAGTVAIAFLPMILGFQMLLQAVLLDVIDKPASLVSHRMEDDL